MKLSIFIIFLVFISSGALKAEENSIQFIRKQFYLAVESEEALEALEKHIIENYSANQDQYPPVILAYKGGVEALKAKYVFSPFSKFSHVINSLDILEQAVKLMPGSLEVRFIRFSILDNIPGIFGYGEERKSDKKVIIAELLKNDFSSLDKETQKGLIEYLLQSSNLTDSEKEILKSSCLAYSN